MTFWNCYFIAGVLLAAFAVQQEYRFYIRTPFLSVFVLTLMVVAGPGVMVLAVALRAVMWLDRRAQSALEGWSS